LPQIAKQWLSGQSYLLIWPFFGLAAALSVVLSQGLQRRYNNVSLLGGLDADVVAKVFGNDLTSITGRTNGNVQHWMHKLTHQMLKNGMGKMRGGIIPAASDAGKQLS
jgi:hypothetical protein